MTTYHPSGRESARACLSYSIKKEMLYSLFACTILKLLNFGYITITILPHYYLYTGQKYT